MKLFETFPTLERFYKDEYNLINRLVHRLHSVNIKHAARFTVFTTNVRGKTQRNDKLITKCYID